MSYDNLGLGGDILSQTTMIIAAKFSAALWQTGITTLPLHGSKGFKDSKTLMKGTYSTVL